MKTDEYNQYAETLARYLGGEMSGGELQDFENEMMASEEDKIIIQKMKKQWKAIESLSETNTPDTRKAWTKLHNRLESENLIPAETVVVKSRLMPRLLRAAAVILILMGVGAVIYFASDRKPATEMVSLDTKSEANTLIKTLTDGSVIYIAQNSLFSFPKEFDGNSRNVALQGEAFFDITPDPGKPFIIETDEALIQVLGTAFNVKTKDGTDFELFVDRGKVKVSLKNDPSQTQMVVAGEKITAHKKSLLKSKYIANPDNRWYRQRMHFKDETLQNIINVLNRNFSTTFVINDKETGNRKLTVTFHNETVETMTELICVTLNLKSQNVNGSVVLSQNKENTK